MLYNLLIKNMKTTTTTLICIAGAIITSIVILKMAEIGIERGQHVKLSNLLMNAEFN